MQSISARSFACVGDRLTLCRILFRAGRLSRHCGNKGRHAFERTIPPNNNPTKFEKTSIKKVRSGSTCVQVRTETMIHSERHRNVVLPQIFCACIVVLSQHRMQLRQRTAVNDGRKGVDEIPGKHSHVAHPGGAVHRIGVVGLARGSIVSIKN